MVPSSLAEARLVGTRMLFSMADASAMEFVSQESHQALSVCILKRCLKIMLYRQPFNIRLLNTSIPLLFVSIAPPQQGQHGVVVSTSN